MLYIKKICLLIFIVITILFTIGYTTQPIFTAAQNQIKPIQTSNTIQQTPKTIIQSFNISSNFTSNDYSNFDNNTRILFTTLFYICIVITILLGVGIILGYIGLKFISKTLFLLSMVIMISVFIIIQIIILINSSLSISNGNGYFLILASVILMIANYLLYVFLA
jgi:hypothetical protein